MVRGSAFFHVTAEYKAHSPRSFLLAFLPFYFPFPSVPFLICTASIPGFRFCFPYNNSPEGSTLAAMRSCHFIVLGLSVGLAQARLASTPVSTPSPSQSPGPVSGLVPAPVTPFADPTIFPRLVETVPAVDRVEASNQQVCHDSLGSGDPILMESPDRNHLQAGSL